MTQPSLGVVVVTYESVELIDPCLSSLERATSGRDMTIVVVDNGSRDGSADHVATHHPDAVLIRNSVNVGFGPAVNQAVAALATDHLLLVNPDAVLEPGAADALLDAAAAHPEAGLLGGRALRAGGQTDWTTARRLPTVRWTAALAVGLAPVLRRLAGIEPEVPRRFRSDEQTPVPMLSGVLLLIDRQAWELLGGFDPRFLLYGEDADLCARAADAGYAPRLVPQARCTHISGASSTSTDKVVRRFAGRVTYMERHWSWPRRCAGITLLRLHVAIRALLVRSAETDWRMVRKRSDEWTGGYPGAGGSTLS